MKKMLLITIVLIGHIYGMEIEQDVPSTPRAVVVLQNLAVQAPQFKVPQNPAKKFICDYQGCSTAFTQFGSLTRHKKIHLGIKPFVCNQEGCDAAFVRSSDLRVHKIIHTGERQYVCNQKNCGKAFTQSSALTLHKKIHSGKKPFVCNHDRCDKAFMRPSDLRLHKRTHTGEKPYVCAYESCNKAFSNQSHLTRHKRSHNKRTHSEFIESNLPSTPVAVEILDELSAKRHKSAEIVEES